MNAADPGRAERGNALVMVLGGILLLSAMGLGLVLLSTTETLSSGNARRASQTLYAAEAGIERALPDLLGAADWSAVVGGRLSSGFLDGAPGGERLLADGRRISLDAVVNLANCGSAGGCTPAAMDAVTEDRPWGRNNPRWRLFAYGPFSALLPPGERMPQEYLVVLVADDPAETDDDPLSDGRPGASPGAGTLLLRAEAFGLTGAHRVVEATVVRGVPASPASGYLAQHGQGRSAGGPAAAGVQTVDGAVARSELASTGGMTRQ